MIIEIARQVIRVEALVQRYPVINEAPDEVQNELKILERIISGGCAIRALESALSAQATDAEYIKWFSDQDQVAQDFTNLLKMIGGTRREIVQAVGHRAEIFQLKKFLEQSKMDGDTPLAEAIRGHTWEQRELLPPGIVDFTNMGHKVLHITHNHVAYVGVSSEGLVRLSDPDRGRLPVLPTYDCLVFTPS